MTMPSQQLPPEPSPDRAATPGVEPDGFVGEPTFPAYPPAQEAGSPRPTTARPYQSDRPSQQDAAVHPDAQGYSSEANRYRQAPYGAPADADMDRYAAQQATDQGADLRRYRGMIMPAVGLLAFVLFLIFRQWWVWMLIPVVGFVLSRMVQAGPGDRHRGPRW